MPRAGINKQLHQSTSPACVAFPHMMTLSGRPLYPQESAVLSGAHLRGLGVCSACLLTHGSQQLSPSTGNYTPCLASSLTVQQQVLVGTSFFV